MSLNSKITIDVTLDDDKMPNAIHWSATSSEIDVPQKAKAMMLSLWDPAEKAALRIDLWTKDMMVDEMNDFFYQTMMTMADTYKRALNQTNLSIELKAFAQDFYQKANDELAKSATKNKE